MLFCEGLNLRMEIGWLFCECFQLGICWDGVALKGLNLGLEMG